MKTDWKVGDTAYCYVGAHQGKLSKGTILAILDLPGYAYLNYVISIPTGVDDLLEVRDHLSMSDKKEGPIGFYELLRHKLKKDKE